MDLPGNFIQTVAFCLDSLVSNKMLSLIKDFSSGGMLIAPRSLNTFLYDKEKSLCNHGGSSNRVSPPPDCFFFW